MIWRLIKRNPLAWATPGVAVAYAVIWWFVSGIRIGGWGFGWMLFLMWMLNPATRGRYTPLELTLPIEGKQLFLSRAVLLLAFVWLPLLTAAGASIAGKGGPAFSGSLPLLEGGAVTTLALLAIQCVRVQTIDPPVWLTYAVWMGFLSLPIMDAFPRSSALTAGVLGVCALASVVLFLSAWAEVPRSFQLAPTKPQGSAPVQMRTERTGDPRLKSPWWPVFRALYFGSGRYAFLAWAMASVIGNAILNAGFTLSAIIWIPIMFAGHLRGLRWLIHLPISAQKVCWMVWFPAVAAIICGLLLSAGMAAFGHADSPGIIANAQVPSGYWRWARGGTAPLIEAPWGESYRPETSNWSGLRFYNPYSAGRESSQRFLEWQFLRATQAVYGQAIPVSHLDELARMKTVLHQPKAQIVVPAILLLYFLVQVCALHLAGWKRLRNFHVAVRLLLAGAPPLVLFPFTLVVFSGPTSVNFLFETTVLRLMAVLPDNLWALALMALTTIAALYWLAQKLWREMEFGQIEGLARQFREPGAGGSQSAWVLGREVS